MDGTCSAQKPFRELHTVTLGKESRRFNRLRPPDGLRIGCSAGYSKLDPQTTCRIFLVLGDFGQTGYKMTVSEHVGVINVSRA